MRKQRIKRFMDRMRWRLIKRLVGKTPDLELVGYALGRAGYTDHPHITTDQITMWRTGATPTF